MAEGGILEEEEGVILETPAEEEILETPAEEETLEIQAEEEEAPEEFPQAMTNYRANSQPSLKETDENQKASCRSGTYITASIDTLLK